MVELTRTHALEEPDIVAASRLVVRTQKRRMLVWIIGIVATGVGATASMILGFDDVAYLLGSAVVVLVVAIAIYTARDVEGPNAHRVLRTWDRVLLEGSEIQLGGPDIADERWPGVNEQLGALRVQPPNAEETNRGLAELRARLVAMFEAQAGLAAAAQRDAPLADGLDEVSECWQELLATAADQLGEALEALRRGVEAGSLELASSMPESDRD